MALEASAFVQLGFVGRVPSRSLTLELSKRASKQHGAVIHMYTHIHTGHSVVFYLMPSASRKGSSLRLHHCIFQQCGNDLKHTLGAIEASCCWGLPVCKVLAWDWPCKASFVACQWRALMGSPL